MNVKQRTGLAIGAGVIALGAAAGIGYAVTGLTGSAQAQGTSSAAPERGSGERGSGEGRPDGRGMPGGMSGLASALAEKLGVEESAVSEAIEEAMKAARPDTDGAAPSGSPGDRTSVDATLAEAVAEKLNLDEATVTKALEEVRAEQAENRPDKPSGTTTASPSQSPTTTG